MDAPTEEELRKLNYQKNSMIRRERLGKPPSKYDLDIIKKRDKLCVYCKKNKSEVFDHIIPLSRNGKNQFNNIVYCCKECNSSKSKKDVTDWIKEKNINPKTIVYELLESQNYIKEEKQEVKTEYIQGDFYFIIYNSIKNGLNITDISKKYNLSKQRLAYYTKHLKAKGLIKKVGYGTWEITGEISKTHLKDGRNPFTYYFENTIRGHGFQFRLIIPRKFKNWEKRESFLTSKGVPFRTVGNKNKIISLKIGKYKVWLCNKSIVIYFSKGISYFSTNALESQQNAIHDFYDIIKKIENMLSISFKVKNKYLFKISKQHYSLIKNEIAKIYEKDGLKLEVRDENNEIWALIDNSYNLHELETVHPQTSQVDMDNKLNPFLNSIRNKPFTSYDFFELAGIVRGLVEFSNNNTENIKEYNENIKLHLETLKEMKETLKEIRDSLKDGYESK